MKKTFLAVIFCLLMSTVVNAECAWVLWSRHEKFEGQNRTVEWKLIGAIPQYEECLKIQKRVLEDSKKVWKLKFEENVEITDWKITIKIGDTTGILTYECLPDTIDPRK